MKKSVQLILLFIGLLFMNGVFAQINTPSSCAVPLGKNTAYKNGIMPTNLPSGGTYGGAAKAAEAYEAWKGAYVKSCSNGQYRVAFDESQYTVSEGIAYGMLLSVYAADKALFDGLWAYYKANSNGNGVMNWKINGCSGTNQANGATDAELDAAMALIIAAEQWSSGSATYTADAKTLIGKIKTYEMGNDGQTLNGDAWGNTNSCRNPSYFAPAYYAEFAKVDANNASFWNTTAISASNTILSKNRSSSGLVSNWCDNSGTENSCGNTGSGAAGYGADACRNPWRMAVDYLWHGSSASSAATDINAKLISFVNGYENQLKGPFSNRSVSNPSSGSYVNGSYTTFALPTMTSSSAQSSLNKCYTAVASLANVDAYFNSTIRCISLFVLTGQFWAPGASGFVFPPTITNAETSSDGKQIILTSNKPLKTSTVTTSNFTYYLNGTAQAASAITGVTISGSTITIAISVAPQPGQTIALSYTGNGGISSTENAALAAFTKIDVLNMLAGNETILDDCDDGNELNNVGGIWFTFNDSPDQNKACQKGTTSSITPLSSAANPIRMGTPGYNSSYALSATYKLGANYTPYDGSACASWKNPAYVGIGTWVDDVETNTMDWRGGTGVTFWYKGPSTTFQIIIKEVTDYCFHKYVVPAATNWTKVTVKWADLSQPTWGKAVTFTAQNVQKLQWQYETGTSGDAGSTGTIWIDDVRILGMPPVALTSMEIGVNPKSKITDPLNLTTTSKDTLKLAITPTPATASYPVVFWTSSDTTVVKVDYQGNIKVIGYGEAIITARSKMHQAITDTMLVKVPPPKVNPTSITFASNSISIAVGETESPVPTFAPTGVTETGLTWTSSNNAIATVSSSGMITGVAAGGPVTITATSTAVTSVKATISVTVTSVLPTDLAVTLTPASIKVGEASAGSVSFTPANTSNKNVTWSSSNTSVATINPTTGAITSVGPGNTTITATSVAVSTVKGSVDLIVSAIAPTTITVSLSPASIEAGGQSSLASVSVAPNNADNTVTWSSSDPSIATIDASTGFITSKAPGSVTITATSTIDNTIKGTADLTVTEILPSLISVTLNPSSVAAGSSSKATAEVTPPNATNKGVKWSSSNTSIATIDETTGEITTLSQGTTIITATSVAKQSITGTATLTVNSILPSSLTVTLTPSAILPEETSNGSVEFNPSNTSDKSVTWSSSNESVATVDKNTGVVTAVAPGNADITATSVAATTVKNTAKITVNAIMPTKVDVTLTPTSIQIDKTSAGSVIFTPEKTSDKTITWTSSAPAIASVDANTGVITGVAVGKATITAISSADNTIKGTAEIDVTAIMPESMVVTLNPSSVQVEGTSTASAAFTPEKTTDKSVTWSSSNTAIATIDENSGVITAVAPGQTEIIATSKALGTVKGTSTFTVTKIPVSGMTIDINSAIIELTKSVSVTPTVLPEKATNKAVTWNTSNNTIASVSNGTITANTVGTVTITVTSDDNNTVSKTISIECVDKSSLSSEIAATQTLYDNATEGASEGMYSNGSKAILLTAINAAIAVKNNNLSTQVQIEQATADLKAATATFKSKVVKIDRTVLSHAIDSATTIHNDAIEGTLIGQYPSGTKATLMTAITNAQAVYDAALSTQAQIDQATSTLLSAINLFKSSINTSDPVNKTSLGDEIASATTLHNVSVEGSADGQYPIGAKATLMTAITTAQGVYDDQTVVQSQVNIALANLQAAVSTFKTSVVKVDKSQLATAITNAQSLHDAAVEGLADGQYTSGSKATLQSAIDIAKGVNTSTSVSQADVTTAISDLQTAVDLFKTKIVKIDKSALNATISSAQNTHDAAVEGEANGQYPVGSKATLQNAIDAAKAIYSDITVSQVQVDKAKKDLEDSVTAFKAKVIKVDKSALASEITSAQAIYTAATEGTADGQYPVGSKATLLTAINIAISVNTNALASQTAVNTAVTDLQSAVSAFNKLVIGVNKGDLIAAITSAQTLHDAAVEGSVNGQYPAGSKTTLQSAIDAANTVKNNTLSSQADVNQALSTLNSAVKAFKDKAVVVDKSVLAGTITNVQDFYDKATEGSADGQYPVGSKSTLKSAIDAAKSINTDVNVTQTQVDNANTDLSKALADFQAKVIGVSKTTLVSSISSAQDLYDKAAEGSADGQYPVGSKAILQSAIDAAVLVNNDKLASQSQVDEAVTALVNATNEFKAKKIGINKTKLSIAIDSAQKVYSGAQEGTSNGKYPVGSKATLFSAITAAQSVKASATSTQIEVDKAETDLYTALSTFISLKISIDKSKLTAAIATVQNTYNDAIEGLADGQYPVGSKDILLTAIAVAKSIETDNGASQAQIDQAVIDINKTESDFKAKVIKVDLTALNSEIINTQSIYDAAIEGEGNNQYEAGSKATLLSVINSAKDVYSNKLSSQIDINNSIDDLKFAVTAFQAKKYTVIKTTLANTITSAQATHDAAIEGTLEGQYPVGEKANLQTAINTAKAVNEDLNASQSTVDDAKKALDVAVASFKAKEVPPTVISTLIADCEDANITKLNTPWYSYAAGISTIAPLATQTVPFAMTIGGANKTDSAASVSGHLYNTGSTITIPGDGATAYESAGIGFAFTNTTPIVDKTTKLITNESDVIYDLTGATGISFWHKGDALNFSIICSNTKQDAGEDFNFAIQAHTDWTLVEVSFTSAKQPGWATLKATWDPTKVIKLQWQVKDGEARDYAFAIDEVRVIGKKLNLSVSADKTALATAIVNAKALYTAAVEGGAEGQYQTGSKATFNTAIAAAETVNNNKSATQTDVDNAVIDLETATNNFKSKVIHVDKSLLTSAINSATSTLSGAVEGESNGQYPAGSKAILQIAINTATSVNTSATSTQQQVNDAVSALQTAEKSFKDKVISVNKTDLIKLISSAQDSLSKAVEGTEVGQYPVGAKADLQTAIGKAQTVSTSTAASQAQVTQAIKDLQLAIDIFVGMKNTNLPVDKSELQTTLATANTLYSNSTEGTSAGQYPVGSKSDLVSAINASKTTYDAQNTTQGQVNSATLTLKAAISAFQAKVFTIDKTNLAKLVSDVQSVLVNAKAGDKPGQYPELAISTLTSELAIAQGVLANAKTQSEISNAETALTLALDKFNKTKVGNPDKTALNLDVINAQGIKNNATKGNRPTEYPELAYTSFENAINTAKAAYNNTELSQTDVNNAEDALESAITTFLASQNPLANKADLDNLIYDASIIKGNAIVGTRPTQYLQTDYDKFVSVIDQAVIVSENQKATQAEVDYQKDALDAAKSKFEASIIKVATKTELNLTIEIAQLLLEGVRVPEDYPEIAETALIEAISDAKTVSVDPKASQNEVNAATASLRSTIELFKSMRNTKSIIETGEEIKVGPNPVDEYLNIIAGSEISSIVIYNVNGKIVETLNPASTSITVNMKDKSVGLYIMNIILSNGEMINRTIIK